MFSQKAIRFKEKKISNISYMRLVKMDIMKYLRLAVHKSLMLALALRFTSSWKLLNIKCMVAYLSSIAIFTKGTFRESLFPFPEDIALQKGRLLLQERFSSGVRERESKVFSFLSFRKKAKKVTLIYIPQKKSAKANNRVLNYLRINYTFEKIKVFHCMNFRLHLTYNSRGALYAMLFSNHK